MILDCVGNILDLNYPQVMGILNITPDSFFDGGDFLDISSALIQAKKMVHLLLILVVNPRVQVHLLSPLRKKLIV